MAALDIATIVLACTWAGLILGSSFLAAPAKFGTPSLTRPVALDVGRHIFKLQLRIELNLAFLFLILTMIGPSGVWRFALPIFVGAVIAYQFQFLQPALDARAQTIIDGGAPPPALHHRIYVALEGS